MLGNWRERAGATFELKKQSATASRGMVVANHPLGAAAGAEMIAAGGNAIDAAIATLFTLDDGGNIWRRMDEYSAGGWTARDCG